MTLKRSEHIQWINQDLRVGTELMKPNYHRNTDTYIIDKRVIEIEC